MTDDNTKKPLQVRGNDLTGPSIRLPLSQVEFVRQMLEQHIIRPYWVDEGALSMNEGPYYTYIRFGRAVKAESVQAILDSVE